MKRTGFGRVRIPVIIAAATALVIPVSANAYADQPTPGKAATRTPAASPASGTASASESGSKPGSGSASKKPVSSAIPVARRDALLGKGWKTSTDRAVTAAADSDGLHLLVAASSSGYDWKTAAVLSEPQLPADTWIGNSCVMDDHHVAVAYAPRTFTNRQDTMLGGAFAAVVDLDSGSVTKLPFNVSLAYFDPTCNPSTGTAAFTAFRDDRTRLVTVDAHGAALADTTATGEITSAVPTADGVVAASGNRLVHVDRHGRATTLAETRHAPYGIRLAPDGTVGFLDRTGDTETDVRTYAHGRTTTVATGALAAVNLRQTVDGGIVLTGHATPTAHFRAGGMTALDVSPDADLSTRGRLAVDPVVSPAVRSGLARIQQAGKTSDSATTGDASGTAGATTEPAPEQQGASSHALTVSGTATTTGKHTSQTAAAPASTAGAATSPTLTGSVRPLTTTSADHDPVDVDRYCSVPRNDVGEQALQPTPNQVEWAVDMAVRGDLTSGWITQGGWRAQSGLGTVDPQALFPVPSLVGGGRIPAQVELGILAQESNLWQAESGAIPGQMGNPLASVAGFYGHTGTAPSDYWKIDWSKSDCGYGVGQVTDGMRLAGHEKPGETALSPALQKGVALDYTVNIAASLQILADKWNEVHNPVSTVTVNNDDASRPENWFTAVWNYNLGFNAPAGTPGSAWGLGWYNNPANPIYPADRLAFMDTSLDPNANHDAATPQYWPYEEKVMGWAAWSIDTGHSYATSGRQDWPGESGFSSAGFQPSWWLTVQDRSAIKPPLDTFCDTSNACDVSNPPPCETQHIEGCDELHWWNAQNTVWKPTCADTCGHESIKYVTLRAEPGRGTRLQYGTPDCAAPPSGALVVDSVPNGTPSWSDCGNAVSDGTFQFTFYPDTDGRYEAKGDLHQIGGGYQGHFWYAHTRDADHLGGDGGRMTVLGDWKMSAPLSKDQAKVYVHIPDTGAQTHEADYQIVTPTGTWDRKISQDAYESDKWVSLGAFHFDGQAPEVRLSNTTDDGTGDDDIAWDAVAFVPGDYDTMPDITFPDAVPDAPDPEAPDDPQPIPATAAAQLTAGGSTATTTPSCAAMAPGATGTCVKILPASSVDVAKAVRTVRQREHAAPAGGATASAKAATTAAAADDSLCLDLPGGRNYTRFAACTVAVVEVDQKVNDKVVAWETFVMEQTIGLAVNNTQVKQTLSLTPYQASVDTLEVSLNVAFDCLSDCGVPVPAWSSPAVWATFADTHTAAATATTSWTQSIGYSELHLSWTLSGTIDGGATTTSSWDEPALVVRCDNEFSGRNAGCVFPEYTPTYEVNTKAYPAAAALYWVLEQKLFNHPGSKAHRMPLHRLADTGLQDENRKIMCQGAVAKWQPNPNTPDVSCDEYAFAASRESGGLQPGVLSGADCVQIYATQVGTQWKLYTDPRYPVPDWNVPCGRGSIPKSQNTDVGGGLGRWTPKMRVRDGDAYYVEEPGFEGCDPDTVCTVSP